MGLESAKNTVIESIEKVAKTSTDLEALAYAGASLVKLVDIDLSNIPNADAYKIGVAGNFGFGVASVFDELLPAGFTKLTGHEDVAHSNYGNVIDEHGSVFVNIPPFHYKMTGNIISISDKALAGYVLPRAFVDNPNGFLHFKYLAGNIGGKLVSKQFLDPLSTSSSHNPIGDLISAPANNYAGFIDACASVGYKTTTIFEWNVLQLIALAQSQSGAGSATCAFNDVAPYFPKGNNNNALADVNDTSVLFTESGYSNCALTGSANNIAKTTHNGQHSGISDVNGNMYKITTGLTYLAKTGASCAEGDTAIVMPSHGLAVDDVIYFGGTLTSGSTYNTGAYTVESVTDANNFAVVEGLEREILDTDGVYSPRYFRILKTSINPNALTSENLLDSALYDLLDMTGIIDSNSGSAYFGNGDETVLNFSTDVNSTKYRLASVGIPTAAGTNATGTTEFGNDRIYKYLRHGLVPLVGLDWDDAGTAGVFGVSLDNCSVYSSYNVGGFASVTLKK